MPLDSDPIITSRTPDDFVSCLTDGLTNIHWKLFGIVFVALIFVETDVFVNRVMGKFPDAVEGRALTRYGAFIKSLLLVLSIVVIDILINCNVI